jgi:hypothetical protein
MRLCTRRKRSAIRHTVITWLSQCSSSRLLRTYNGYGEKNQLKYVCKRLYNETRGLELQHSLITFEDTVTMNAVESYMFLHHRCTALQTVAIKCSLSSFAISYNSNRFSEIAAYCTANAKLSVRIHVPYWSQGKSNFILLGLHFLSTFRGDASSTARLAQKTLAPFYSPSKFTTILGQMPGNIRLFPKEERFDQQILQQSCRKNPRIRLPTTQETLQEVMDLMKDWFEDGL